MAKLLKKAVALLVTATCLQHVQAAPLTVSSEKAVLLVSEAVSPNGAVSTTARSGPLTTSGSVFSIDRVGSASIAAPVSIPAINLSGGFGSPTGLPTQDDAADIANAHLRAHYAGVKTSLGTYMRKYGITSAWFNFKQRVELDVNGSPETWTIYWDFFTDANNRGAFGEAKIVPDDPKTLYVVYTPLRVANGLPASFAFDGAGTLKYQLRDAQFQPVTNWVTVNVGGIYDTLESGLESHDGGLACMMDTSKAGCTPSTTDVKNLMDRTGAVMTVVDYTRRVEPVYEAQPDGTTKPKMTAKLLNRQLVYSGCNPPTFRNVGDLQYTLATTVARYLAGPVGSPRTVQYEQIQEFQGTYESPGLPYDLSMQVPRRDTVDLAPKAIDPVLKDRLMALADIPGLAYPVLPIEIIGDPAATIGSTTGMVWQYGGRDDAYQMNWKLRCAQYDDGYELATTIDSTEDWNGWHPNTPAMSLVSSTGWSPVAVNGFGPSRYQAYADYAAGIVRLQDGTTSGSYSYRSSGGGEGGTSGFICAHNRWSMMAPNGTAYECNTPPAVSYSCGALSRPYDYYVDGIYRGHVSQAACTGHRWIRGLYMSNGSPYYEYQELSRVDRSGEAVNNCRNGVCAWEVRDGVEPRDPEPEPEPEPAPLPEPDPWVPPSTPTPEPEITCWEDNWKNDWGCPAGQVGENYSITYMECPNGPYGQPTHTQRDYTNTCTTPPADPSPAPDPGPAPAPDPIPVEPTPPQLPPVQPPKEECGYEYVYDDVACSPNSFRTERLHRHVYYICGIPGVGETSRTPTGTSELWAQVWCDNGVVTDFIEI